MPELPEVETVVRSLQQPLAQRQITEFSCFWTRTAQPNPGTVARLCRGRRIEAVTRRGKWIVLQLSGGPRLAIHLRMSGRLCLMSVGENPSHDAHVRAAWRFTDGGSLVFSDARKFGRIRAAESERGLLPPIGVEPLGASFSDSELRVILHRNRMLKPLLLDQALICGIGNIYCDEILFQAGLHPSRSAATLSDSEILRLHAAIRHVLAAAIERQGTSFDWVYPGGQMQNYLNVYGRAGQSCPRCGGPIERLLIAQRSSHVCPRCQPPRGAARRARTPEAIPLAD